MMNTTLKTLSALLMVVAGEAGAQTMLAYGIEIGGPLGVPECPKMILGQSASYLASTTLCMKGSPARPTPADYRNGGFMIFPPGQAPVHSRSEMVGIYLYNGNIGAIFVHTQGLVLQDAIFSDLVAKYGKPTTSEMATLQNRMGASYAGIVATWQLGDFQVEFLGATTSIDQGLLTIGSTAALRQRAAKQEEQRNAAGRPL